ASAASGQVNSAQNKSDGLWHISEDARQEAADAVQKANQALAAAKKANDAVDDLNDKVDQLSTSRRRR
ncbi:MAG: hypothetical protein JO218_19010, partial [Burkholderiales bacterium]|nr:hypothetical protein [Burkholderiales bacterium]